MKECFVVMGFGMRTDFPSGRVLNLDATYENLIKPAVTEANLECVRADELSGTGTVDVNMFEQLLQADVVIADVSTSNPNAFYELGVRHALRPYATIIIAEQNMQEQQLPFNINHVAVLFYKHLGEDIGAGEVNRFRPVLSKACKVALTQQRTDSPVYTFLGALQAPKKKEGVSDSPGKTTSKSSQDLASLLEDFRGNREAGNYGEAARILEEIRKFKGDDPYILQQLAYVTYMDRSATPISNIERAREILRVLNPEKTNDPQTLGLWGAIHKRLFELSNNDEKKVKYLDESINSYRRGFTLRNDHYNGINLAYMLNVRSNNSSGAEAIADFVNAQRVRKEVVELCESLLEETDLSKEDLAWIHASLAEGYLALGDQVRADNETEQALTLLPSEADRTNLLDKLELIREFANSSVLNSIQ